MPWWGPSYNCSLYWGNTWPFEVVTWWPLEVPLLEHEISSILLCSSIFSDKSVSQRPFVEILCIRSSATKSFPIIWWSNPKFMLGRSLSRFSVLQSQNACLCFRFSYLTFIIRISYCLRFFVSLFTCFEFLRCCSYFTTRKMTIIYKKLYMKFFFIDNLFLSTT